jgi:hypothetical protein
MGARRRRPVVDLVAEAAVVPAELLGGFRHPTWLSTELTTAWYVREFGSPPSMPTVFSQLRWSRAVDDWARLQGVVDAKEPSLVDHRRLRAMGVSRVPVAG